MTEAIKIDGLRDFQRMIKDMDRDLPKALRVALNSAVDLVTDEARSKVPVRRGKAQGSIKSKSTQTSARVGAGGNQAPYYPWLDFGGRVGRKHSVERQFRKRGRYLYLAYFEQRDSGAFQEALSAAIDEIAAQAGLEIE